MLQKIVFQNVVASEGMLADQRNLLALRAFAFSLFPLLLGIQHVRLAGRPLTRRTLRPMFYAQCYVTVPFVLAVDLALLFGNARFTWAGPLGMAIIVAGLIWYFRALMRGFMVHRNATRRKAIAQSVLAILMGGICLAVTLVLFVLTATVPLPP